MSVGLAAAASDRPHDRRRKQQFILREQIDVALEFGLGDQAQFDQFISGGVVRQGLASNAGLMRRCKGGERRPAQVFE